jgi:dTDP-4-dehydrorhamnose reductase
MDNQKIKIFTIGGSGLVGSRVNEILSEKYNIDNLSRKSGINITQENSLNTISADTRHQIVILYAAKTDVDGAELDKELGENGEAYKMNVIGVQNILNACRPSSKKLILLSTDFVFNGQNTPEKGFSEEDTPHPINWYGQTKYLGEEAVRNSGLPYLIIRIGYPYRKEFEQKKDFVRALRDRLQNNLPVTAVTDHIMTPTFIDDIASALDILIATNQDGIFHVTGSKSLSPYEAALKIADVFDCERSLIKKTTRMEFFKGRATRPLNLTMNNDKIGRLGIKMKTFEEGLSQFL